MLGPVRNGTHIVENIMNSLHRHIDASRTSSNQHTLSSDRHRLVPWNPTLYHPHMGSPPKPNAQSSLSSRLQVFPPFRTPLREQDLSGSFRRWFRPSGQRQYSRYPTLLCDMEGWCWGPGICAHEVCESRQRQDCETTNVTSNSSPCSSRMRTPAFRPLST